MVRVVLELLRSVVRTARRSIVRGCGVCLGKPLQCAKDGRIVIVAPHPDDEVLGCGGLVAMRMELGARVDIVFLTAGEGAHRGCCDAPEREVAAARQVLAIKALGVLGLGLENLHWLGMSDGEAPREGQDGFELAADRLASVISEVGPREVYCPHPKEVWPDHVAACELTLAAVAKAGLPCHIRFYLVWAWLNKGFWGLMRLGWRGCWRLDVRSVMDKKRRAIRIYTDETSPRCGKPWSGVLPRDLMEAFEWPVELVFDADVQFSVVENDDE